MQADFDVAQALAMGQLRERHTVELAGTGKSLDVAVALMASDTGVEHVHRQVVHQLRENQSPGVHVGPPDKIRPAILAPADPNQKLLICLLYRNRINWF